MPLNPQQVREIAARGLLDPRTIRRAYTAPASCRVSALQRVAQAAASLGLPLPERPAGAQPAPR